MKHFIYRQALLGPKYGNWLSHFHLIFHACKNGYNFPSYPCVYRFLFFTLLLSDVAERVFDRCLSYGAEKNPERLDYEITFNYEFLDDSYSKWIREGIKRKDNPEGSDYSSSTGHLFVMVKENHYYYPHEINVIHITIAIL